MASNYNEPNTLVKCRKLNKLNLQLFVTSNPGKVAPKSGQQQKVSTDITIKFG